jgi:hypothetical protein
MNSSYSNNRNQSRPPYRGTSSHRPQTRSNAPTPYRGKRKRFPPKFARPTWPTRAVKRDERTQRIEYHVINLLRERMAPDQFEKMMNMARRLARQEEERVQAAKRAKEAAKAAKKQE